jgi:hypothetical protein
MIRLLIPRLSLLLLTGGAGIVLACSVPVFRYALERWSADDFRIIVFHQGAPTPAQAGWVRDLDRPGLAGRLSANLTLRTVDLTTTTDAALLRFWQPLANTTPLPAMVLLYPPGFGLPKPAWKGPLTGENVSQLLDSPARREIAGRLLRGESAVWVMLDSGDLKLDTPAAQRLEARLRHLESTLQLPELSPADVGEGAVAAAQGQLRIAFSLLRVSRQNPAEAVLVSMLLNTEEDLAAAREPMVFPVFGRGRVLYALVGPGINDETIDEAGGFLTGACSCIVKEQNPGSDLLLSVDWTRLVEPLIKSDAELPPLPGLAEFAAVKSTVGAPPRTAAGASAPTGSATLHDAPPPVGAASAESRRGAPPFVPGLIFVIALGGGTLLGATWWLLRRRG